jgi:hypothetical protein
LTLRTRGADRLVSKPFPITCAGSAFHAPDDETGLAAVDRLARSPHNQPHKPPSHCNVSPGNGA